MREVVLGQSILERPFRLSRRERKITLVQEYVDEAIVLYAEPNGDFDCRFSLFTKRFGRFSAKAKSIKKITSKLASHLQPGNVIATRIVEKKGLQIVDALKRSRLNISPYDLYLLHKVLPEAEPELEIWEAIAEGKMDWMDILRRLGWDPREAKCERCHAAKPKAFRLADQAFFCGTCASNLEENEVIYMYRA